MVLLLQGAVAPCPKSTQELYQSYPVLVESAKSFSTTEEVHVGNSHALYVSQAEYGIVPGDDPVIQIIGSDDATTCHVIVLRHNSGTTAVAHFDGRDGESEAVNDMVHRILEIEGPDVECLTVWVAGGYEPERGSKEAARNESELLSLKILKILTEHKMNFDLALWCTCILNTTEADNINDNRKNPKPIIYGLGVDVQKGDVYPAYFDVQEPNLALRSASRWAAHSGPKNIYDYKTKTITIHPFAYDDMLEYGNYCSLPDGVLLKYFSTSPKVEPKRFCENLRNLFRIFADNPVSDMLFPNQRSIVYRLSKDGYWRQL